MLPGCLRAELLEQGECAEAVLTEADLAGRGLFRQFAAGLDSAQCRFRRLRRQRRIERHAFAARPSRLPRPAGPAPASSARAPPRQSRAGAIRAARRRASRLGMVLARCRAQPGGGLAVHDLVQQIVIRRGRIMRPKRCEFPGRAASAAIASRRRQAAESRRASFMPSPFSDDRPAARSAPADSWSGLDEP